VRAASAIVHEGETRTTWKRRPRGPTLTTSAGVIPAGVGPTLRTARVHIDTIEKKRLPDHPPLRFVISEDTRPV
jgi:hypothetical protein